MSRFTGAYPISGEDLLALPVKAIAPAVAFYESVLGFKAVTQDDSSAILERDDARVGLVRQIDHNPGEAGSFCISVEDITSAHGELQGKPAAEVGSIGTNAWGGKSYRTFFVRENENGYCFCFSQPL